MQVAQVGYVNARQSVVEFVSLKGHETHVPAGMKMNTSPQSSAT